MLVDRDFDALQVFGGTAGCHDGVPFFTHCRALLAHRVSIARTRLGDVHAFVARAALFACARVRTLAVGLVLFHRVHVCTPFSLSLSRFVCVTVCVCGCYIK